MAARSSQQVVEVLHVGAPTVRSSQQTLEVLAGGNPAARISQVAIEVLIPAGFFVTSNIVFTHEAEAELVEGSSEIEVEADNTIVFTQDVDLNTIINRTVEHTLVLTQEALNLGAVEQTITFTHEVVLQVIRNRLVEHTLTFTQAAYRIQEGDGESTLDLDHEVLYILSKNVVANNTIVFTQDADCEKIINRSVISTLVPTQTAFKNLSKIVTATNTLVFNQTAIGINTKPAINTIVFTQDADFVLAKRVTSTIEFTQTVARNIVTNRSLFSNFIPFQILTTGPNTFRRTIEHTLTLNHSVLGFVVKGATNFLPLIQTVDFTLSKKAANTLVMTQTVSVNKVYARSVTNTFIPNNIATKIHSKKVQASNSLGFNQTLTGKRVFNKTATNTLILTQELVREKIPKAVEQTIVFDDTAEVEKIVTKTVAQSLVFTQTVALQKNITRNVLSVLTFSHGQYKYVGLGDIGTIWVPSPVGILVKNLVTLYGDDRSITLPAPEFDDGEGFTGRLNIIRFTGGAKRIYKKDSDKYKHSYNFVVDYHKIRELMLFISFYNSRTFRMENHKGEVWLVVFANNPFEHTEAAFWGEECGNKFTITLEFEGVRLS